MCFLDLGSFIYIFPLTLVSVFKIIFKFLEPKWYKKYKASEYQLCIMLKLQSFFPQNIFLFPYQSQSVFYAVYLKETGCPDNSLS